MTEDDVDGALRRLERQLDELQAELHAPAPHVPPAPAAPPAPPAAAPPLSRTPRVEPLEQFGVELRRLAHELVAAYDRVLEHEKRRAPARTIELESEADLHALAELERALTASPGVAEVSLRAYEHGRAQLTVEFEPRP